MTQQKNQIANRQGGRKKSKILRSAPFPLQGLRQDGTQSE